MSCFRTNEEISHHVGIDPELWLNASPTISMLSEFTGPIDLHLGIVNFSEAMTSRQCSETNSSLAVRTDWYLEQGGGEVS